MTQKKVFIIAEAGVNHNGSLVRACKMIYVAAQAGADAVKFQTFKTQEMTSRFARKEGYQRFVTNPDESQVAMLKKLELNENAHRILLAECKKNRIQFLSSPFDIPSVDFLNSIGLDTFKIPSGEINNYPYLQKIGRLRKKIILSTGMASEREINDALNILLKAGTNRRHITLLYCNSSYPVQYADVHLRAMNRLKEKFHLNVGFSDHTLGIEVAVAAVARGAQVIEKHFTLNKRLPGPDHKASLDSQQLRDLVVSIRNVQEALGNERKPLSKSELENRIIFRKSIVAAKQIKKGERFSQLNLTTKRPGKGLSPMRWERLIGKTAQKEYQPDEMIIQ